MSDHYVEDQQFEGISFSEEGFMSGHYQDCFFVRCDLSGVDLSHSIFEDVRFDQCNLTGVRTEETAFRNVKFVDTKLLGIDWSPVRAMFLEMHFCDCQLDLSSFYGCSLKSSSFRRCSLREVDFVNTNLSGVALLDCNLQDAQFESTDMKGADLTGAHNYIINPEINVLNGAKVSWPAASGLLHQYDLKWGD